jgi:hypothetical protein
MCQRLAVASTCFSSLQAGLVRAYFATPGRDQISYQMKLTLSPVQHNRKSFNMLPPVDPTVVASNPKFEALYRDLTTNKLNKDGSSKLDVKAQRERDTLREVWQHLHRSLRIPSRAVPIDCFTASRDHAISIWGH